MTDLEIFNVLEMAKHHIKWCWDHIEHATRMQRSGSKDIHDQVDTAINALYGRVFGTENTGSHSGLPEKEVMMPDCRWRTCKPNQEWLIRLNSTTMLNAVRIKRIFQTAVELEPITRPNGMLTAIYEINKDFNFIEQLGEG